MVYKAKTHRGYLGGLWLAVVSSFIVPTPEWFLTVQLILTGFILLALFTAFTFSLNEEGLEYRIKTGKFLHYQISFKHGDVQSITLGRAWWARKGAVVKMKSGYNMRLADFEPCPIEMLEGYGKAIGVPVINKQKAGAKNNK